MKKAIKKIWKKERKNGRNEERNVRKVEYVRTGDRKKEI